MAVGKRKKKKKIGSIERLFLGWQLASKAINEIVIIP